MRIVRYNALAMFIVVALSTLTTRADFTGFDVNTQKDNRSGRLAEKGVQGLAKRLGSAILKLRDQEFSKALGPRIQLTPRLRKAMQGTDNMKSLKAAASRVDAIDCVGFNMISTQAATFVYVLVNKKGPLGLKFNVHIFRDQFYISGFSASSSWESIEKMYNTVEPLQSKLHLSRKDSGETKGNASRNDLPTPPRQNSDDSEGNRHQ